MLLSKAFYYCLCLFLSCLFVVWCFCRILNCERNEKFSDFCIVLRAMSQHIRNIRQQTHKMENSCMRFSMIVCLCLLLLLLLCCYTHTCAKDNEFASCLYSLFVGIVLPIFMIWEFGVQIDY